MYSLSAMLSASIGGALLLTFLLAPAMLYAADDYWVLATRLNKRTCPATTCGVSGTLVSGQRVQALETRAGWARITDYSDAACQDGVSQRITQGNSQCAVENGIAEGVFAEWVLEKYLGQIEPVAKPYHLIKGSDDLEQYKEVFAEAAGELIKAGTCTPEDFVRIGGWLRSAIDDRRPIYFTYCGEFHIKNRYYLNGNTGVITQ